MVNPYQFYFKQLYTTQVLQQTFYQHLLMAIASYHDYNEKKAHGLVGASHMNLANLDLQYITDSQGEKTSVILPINQFEELLEELEDLATVLARRDEPTTDHQDFITD